MFPSRLLYRLFGKRAGVLCSTGECTVRRVYAHMNALIFTAFGVGAAAWLVAARLGKAHLGQFKSFAN